MRVLIVLLCLAGVAAADKPPRGVWRVKVNRPSSGELIGWPKNRCGADIADNVWRIVKKRPYIEYIDGEMAARVSEPRPVPAKKSRTVITDESFTAMYDPSDDRTIAFTIRYRAATKHFVPVEVSVIYHPDPNDRTKACRETWLGAGERI